MVFNICCSSKDVSILEYKSPIERSKGSTDLNTNKAIFPDHIDRSIAFIQERRFSSDSTIEESPPQKRRANQQSNYSVIEACDETCDRFFFEDRCILQSWNEIRRKNFLTISQAAEIQLAQAYYNVEPILPTLAKEELMTLRNIFKSSLDTHQEEISSQVAIIWKNRTIIRIAINELERHQVKKLKFNESRARHFLSLVSKVQNHIEAIHSLLENKNSSSLAGLNTDHFLF